MREFPVRKNIRLESFDYSRAGYYFITICVKDRHELLGRVVGATALSSPFVELTPLGIYVDETIKIAAKDGIEIDKYVIMPNHMHMIIVLRPGTGDRGRSPLQFIVRNVKSYVTKWARFSIWQRSFYDHIIHDNAEYQRIWQYIDENPINWTEDEYYITGQ